MRPSTTDRVWEYNPEVLDLPRGQAAAGKQQIIGDQSTFRPHFHGREINGCRWSPRTLEKRRPRIVRLRSWSRFDPVPLEDVADRLVGHLVSDVGQGVGDPVVAPGGVFFGELQNQVDDFLGCWWSAYLADAGRCGPISGPPVPSASIEWYPAWLHRLDLSQHLAAQNLAFDGQSARAGRR